MVHDLMKDLDSSGDDDASCADMPKIVTCQHDEKLPWPVSFSSALFGTGG